MSEWQPIETAPKDGTSILAWTAGGICEIAFEYGEFEQLPCFSTYDDCGSAVLICKPTHWMPLPPPPQQ